MTRRPHIELRAQRACAALASLLLYAATAPVQADPPAGAPQLSLPIACEPGSNCFVQSHVDLDPGPDARDYRCGSATYDGHKGLDIRLLSAAEAATGVAVLAAADGVVKGVRDGMEDRFATGKADARIAERECGNGVVIDHGAGWETQYCHMRKGSLAVRVGDRIARGARLGDVGYSGLAQFAHIHLSLRHDGAVVDPMSGMRLGAACAADPQTAQTGAGGLWDAPARAALAYRNGEVIGAGFAGGPLDPDALEVDHAPPAPTAESPALVFFARFVNLRAGDRVRLAVTGPGGFDLDTTTEPLPRAKATYVSFAGRKRAQRPRWPAGTYTGRIELVRAGAIAARRDDVRFELQ